MRAPLGERRTISTLSEPDLSRGSGRVARARQVGLVCATCGRLCSPAPCILRQYLLPLSPLSLLSLSLSLSVSASVSLPVSRDLCLPLSAVLCVSLPPSPILERILEQVCNFLLIVFLSGVAASPRPAADAAHLPRAFSASICCLSLLSLFLCLSLSLCLAACLSRSLSASLCRSLRV